MACLFGVPPPARQRMDIVVILIYNVSVGVIAPTVGDKVVLASCVAFAIAVVFYLVWMIRMPRERWQEVTRDWPEGE